MFSRFSLPHPPSSSLGVFSPPALFCRYVVSDHIIGYFWYRHPGSTKLARRHAFLRAFPTLRMDMHTPNVEVLQPSRPIYESSNTAHSDPPTSLPPLLPLSLSILFLFFPKVFLMLFFFFFFFSFFFFLEGVWGGKSSEEKLWILYLPEAKRYTF